MTRATAAPDDPLRDARCPRCGRTGVVVWDHVSGRHRCSACRVGVQPQTDEAPPRRATSAAKRGRFLIVRDYYQRGEDTVELTYRLSLDHDAAPLEPDPRLLAAYRKHLRPVVLAERRVERDRLRRRGLPVPKRLGL